MHAISVQGLRKSYGDHEAVRGLDLDVPQGSFFGLLGPNGAGKTTTIGAISGLVRPTSGRVMVMGHDAWKAPGTARHHIGLCAQEPNFDDFLGIERILAFHAGYFGMPYAKALDRARELLKFFDLHDYRLKRTSTLSGGMKRRLLLARALMHEPDVLILDEPTAGVDVELRRNLWEHVRRLNDEGTTILLTTHYLEEAEALCDEVSVIDRGQVVERGTPDGLRHKYGVRRVVIVPEHLPPATMQMHGFESDAQGRLVLESTDPTKAMRAMLRELEAADIDVVDIDVSQSRLEDVFVHLTRRDRHQPTPVA